MKEQKEKYNFPKGWVKASIRDVLMVHYGKSLPKKDRKDGNFPVYGSNGIIGFHNDFLIQEPVIIIGRKGSAGAIHLSYESSWPIDTTYFIKPSSELNFKFLYYLLIHLNLNKLDKSTTIPGLNREILYEQTIKLPPFNEQKKIVQRLEELLSSLEKTQDQLSTSVKKLDIYQKTILNNLFNKNTYKKVLTEKNINNWGEYTLDEVCEKITDGSHFSPKSEPSGYPYITVKDIKDDLIDFENSLRISKEDYLSLVNTGCQPLYGDVLFSKDGTVGKVSVVNFEKEFVVLSSLAILRSNPIKILPRLLFYILKSPYLLNQALDQKKGVAIRRIVLRDLKKLEIKIPLSIDDQNLFVSKLDMIFSYCNELRDELNTRMEQTKILKQSLLDRAFEGKLLEQDYNDEPAEKLLERLKFEIEKNTIQREENSIKKREIKTKSSNYSFLKSLEKYFQGSVFSIEQIKKKIKISDEMLKEELFKLLETKKIISSFNDKKGIIIYKLTNESHQN